MITSPSMHRISILFSFSPKQGPAVQCPSSIRNRAPWVAQMIWLLPSWVRKLVFRQFRGVPTCGHSLKYPKIVSFLRTINICSGLPSSTISNPRHSPSFRSSSLHKFAFTVWFHPLSKLIATLCLRSTLRKGEIAGPTRDSLVSVRLLRRRVWPVS